MSTIATDLEVRPVAGHLGAEVRGLDLRDPLEGEALREVEAALHRHGVLFFSGQELGPEHHRAFALQFGKPHLPHADLGLHEDERYPEIAVISTDNGRAQYSHRWHSDVTWRPEPSRYSVLHMIDVPPVGGDTMWSSQHLAFESLSAPLRAMLEGLTAHHELNPAKPEMCADHPVVIRHPVTDRKSLFVNGLFTTRINELEPHESAALLAMLIANGTRPELTCRWRFTEGDLVIWDNHFVQHYAIGDYGDARRRINRIEIIGSAPLPA